MTLKEALDAAARDYIVAVLTESRGIVTNAAKKAGVHRTHFYKLMEKHRVTVEHTAVCNSGADSGKIRSV